MKIRIKQFLGGFLLLSILLITGISQAQEAEMKKEKEADEFIFTKHWYLQGQLGLNTFYGDITNDDNAVVKHFTESRAGGSLILGWQFHPIWGVRGDLFYGGLKGERPNRYFETELWSAHLEPTISISNIIKKKERKFNIYALTGIGMSNWEAEQFQSEDKNTRIGGNGVTEDWTSEVTIPVGAGVDYKLNESWSLNLESRLFYVLGIDDDGGGDMMDGDQAGAANENNDAFNFFGAGVKYKLGMGADLETMAKEFETVQFEVTPDPLEEHGNTINVEVEGTVPEKYFGKTAAVQMTPVLKYGNDSTKLKPITLIGEKVEGKGVTINHKEGGTFSYQDQIPYDPSMNVSELEINPLFYKPQEGVSEEMSQENIMLKMKYVKGPIVKIGDGVIYTQERVMHDEHLYMANKETAKKLGMDTEEYYEKETIVSKTATIYFKINRANLNWNFYLNDREKAKEKVEYLKDFIRKGWKIKNIEVHGWASPDGEISFNENLSEWRVETATKYLDRVFAQIAKKKELTVTKPSEAKKLFSSKAHGEDWEGFMRAIKASDIEDKAIILNVVNQQTDPKKREQEIRNMTVVFKEIAEEILPPLRRAELTVAAYEPKHTDEELENMAMEDPGSLKQKELLYAGSLQQTPSEQLEVYEKMIEMYPDDWKGYNNAAYILLSKDQIDQAEEYLEEAKELSNNNPIILNNLGVVESKKENYKQAKVIYLTAEKHGADIDYNHGIIMIDEGKYEDALSLFGGKDCNHNVALAQYLAGNAERASNTLKCAPDHAKSFYLMAVIAESMDDTDMMYDYLVKAVQADPSLKSELEKDRVFLEYHDKPDFKGIVE